MIVADPPGRSNSWFLIAPCSGSETSSPKLDPATTDHCTELEETSICKTRNKILDKEDDLDEDEGSVSKRNQRRLRDLLKFTQAHLNDNDDERGNDNDNNNEGENDSDVESENDKGESENGKGESENDDKGDSEIDDERDNG